MIEAQNLSVAYENRLILRDINLHFAANSVTALVGPNGCGKSTLLKTLAGLHKPQSGQVLLQDHPLQALKRKAIAQKIAYMAQAPQAPEGLTVRQLVEHGAFARRRLFKRQDHEEVNELLAACGLSPLAERPFAEMSGGEQQRAWIAMCLLQKASFLLLDEPTSCLDLGYQINILQLVEKLRKIQHFGVIMVLHDINQASHFANRIVALKDGSVVSEGAPHEVVSNSLIQTLYDAEVTVQTHPKTASITCVPNYAG